jgi:hypothetical protein
MPAVPASRVHHSDVELPAAGPALASVIPGDDIGVAVVRHFIVEGAAEVVDE